MSTAEQQSKALAFLRISIGLIFLILAEYKLTTKFIWGGMATYFGHFIDQGCYPFMRPFLERLASARCPLQLNS
jgi:uncharacterized protein YggT (Ycf19 family)